MAIGTTLASAAALNDRKRLNKLLPKKRKQQELIYVIIILITVVLLIVLLSPFLYKSSLDSRNKTLNSSNNLQSYENDLFSFQYSPDWNLTSSDNTVTLLKTTEGVNESGGVKKINSAITVSYVPVEPTLSLEEFLNSLDLSHERIDNLSKKIKLGSADAVYFVMQGAAAYNGNGVVSIHNGFGYEIKVEGNISDEKALQTIINSFKFK